MQLYLYCTREVLVRKIVLQKYTQFSQNLRFKVRKIAKFWARIRAEILLEFTALIQ